MNTWLLGREQPVQYSNNETCKAHMLLPCAFLTLLVQKCRIGTGHRGPLNRGFSPHGGAVGHISGAGQDWRGCGGDPFQG